LEALVGRGGTSSVYAAIDNHMRRRVAVKVIHPEHARTEPQRRRIRSEARIAGSLDHPNLTPMLDFGEERTADGETLCFLVMPLLEGRSLTELVADGAVPWQRCVSLIRQVLAGVAALHAAGVLHRDLKASNCFVTPCRGRELLRVLDFGLAKVDRPDLVSVPSRSTAGPFVGTLAYAAPEQVLERAVDARADLYAVGMILYYLLTRRLPFSMPSSRRLRRLRERLRRGRGSRAALRSWCSGRSRRTPRSASPVPNMRRPTRPRGELPRPTGLGRRWRC